MAGGGQGGWPVVYAINYDLRQPGRDYEGLYRAIKTCGDWWHFLGSTWLVDTPLNAGQVWDRLAPHVHRNDIVLIHAVGHDKQGWLPQNAWDWINARQPAMA